MTKLIELWKTNCGDCEALKPTIAKLEKEGYEFDKYSIANAEVKNIIEAYQNEITSLNKEKGIRS